MSSITVSAGVTWWNWTLTRKYCLRFESVQGCGLNVEFIVYYLHQLFRLVDERLNFWLYYCQQDAGKRYGFVPRMKRCNTLHKLMWYLVYGYNKENLTDEDSKPQHVSLCNTENTRWKIVFSYVWEIKNYIGWFYIFAGSQSRNLWFPGPEHFTSSCRRDRQRWRRWCSHSYCKYAVKCFNIILL